MRALRARTPAGPKTAKTPKTRKLRPSDTALTCAYALETPSARSQHSPTVGTRPHGDPVPDLPGTRAPPVPGYLGTVPYGVPAPYPCAPGAGA